MRLVKFMRSKHSKSFILTKKLRSYWFYQSSTYSQTDFHFRTLVTYKKLSSYLWEHWFWNKLMCSMQLLKEVIKCKVVFKSLFVWVWCVVTSHMQILSQPIIVLYVVVSLFFCRLTTKKSFLKIKILTHKSHPYINRWFSERKKCKTIFTSHLSYIYLIFPSC